jgi:AAA+ ATPase superfamily predicted ATPase
MFLGRLQELEHLKKLHMKGGKKLITLSGPVGSGKTELVNQLMLTCRSLYLIPNGYSERGIVKSFWSQMVSSGIGKVSNAPSSYADILGIIKDDSVVQSLLLVIDSFQEIAAQSRKFISEFNSWWDSLPISQNLSVILVMSSPVIPGPSDLRSPKSIFSRTAERMVLEDLPYADTLPFLSGLTSEEAITVYSVFGGRPQTLVHFNPRMNFEKNIEDNILSKSSYLYNYAKFTLLSGLKDRYKIYDILQSMAYAPKTLEELSADTGLAKRELQSELRLLESKYAVIQKSSMLTDKAAGTRTLFSIKDYFARFWFAFMRPNMALLELDRPKEVENAIRVGLDRHTARTFTDICLQHLRDYVLGRERQLLYYTWKGEASKIDIIALDKETLDAYFVDTDWTKSPLLKDSVEALSMKSREVPWMRGKRKDHFIIYSKMGFRFESAEALLVNINTLQRDLSMPRPTKPQEVFLKPSL